MAVVLKNLRLSPSMVSLAIVVDIEGHPSALLPIHDPVQGFVLEDHSRNSYSLPMSSSSSMGLPSNATTTSTLSVLSAIMSTGLQ